MGRTGGQDHAGRQAEGAAVRDPRAPRYSYLTNRHLVQTRSFGWGVARVLGHFTPLKQDPDRVEPVNRQDVSTKNGRRYLGVTRDTWPSESCHVLLGLSARPPPWTLLPPMDPPGGPFHVWFASELLLRTSLTLVGFPLK